MEQRFLLSWMAVRIQTLQAIRHEIVQCPNYGIIMAGHSLGAVLATLAAADARGEGHPSTLYSYGSPRVGNHAFAVHLMAQAGNLRLTRTNDPAPMLPPQIIGYVHLGPEYWITAPDNTSPSPDQIQVLAGLENPDGNDGTRLPLPLDLPAHWFYFHDVPLCKGSGFP